MLNRLKPAILLSFISIASVSAAMLTPALPIIEKQWALAHGHVEWLVSVFLVGYVFGQLIYGPLANRFGRLNALRIGLTGNLAGLILCYVAASCHSFSWLLAGRLISALGAACGLACTFMLINELLPIDKAKKLMAYTVVSFTLGAGLAVLFGGLVTQYWHWSGCFILLMFHGVLMLGCTWLFPETLSQKQPLNIAHLVAGYLHSLRSKKLIVFSMIAGINSSFTYCFAASAPLYAHTVLQLTPSQYGYWNFANIIGMLTNGFLGAALLRRFDTRQVLRFGLFMTAPTLAILVMLAVIHNTSASAFFLTTMLVYVFSGLAFPTSSYLASNAIADRASASSMMSFINMSCATLNVIILGYLPFTSLSAFATTMAVFYFIAMFFYLFLIRD